MAQAATLPAVALPGIKAWWAEVVARAPILPVAIAFSAGIFGAEWQPLPPWLGVFPALVLAWVAWRMAPVRAIALALAFLAMGHAWRSSALQVKPDGIMGLARDTPSPVRLRGVVVDGPWEIDAVAQQFPGRIPENQNEWIVDTFEVFDGAGWCPVSGRVRVRRPGDRPDLAPGWRVEMLGRLSLVSRAMNPGEVDSRALALRTGVQAEMRQLALPDDLLPLPGRAWRIDCLLAAIRQWGAIRLRGYLAPDVADLGAALILGDTRPVGRADWQVFMKTGVIHVLAISGQHLVFLAGGLIFLGRIFSVASRPLRLFVALVVGLYALITGGNPSAVRAAATVGSVSLAWLGRRQVSLINTLALSWMVVAIFQPGDLGSTGSLLSFLATGLLYWSVNGWSGPPTEEDEAYERALDLGRSAWARTGLWAMRWVLAAYWVNLILWLGLAPLLASRTHMLSLVGLLLGPPVGCLGAMGLAVGFPLLFLGQIPGVSLVLGGALTGLLRACLALARGGESLPLAWLNVTGPPGWWLVLFYFALIAGLTGRISVTPRRVLACLCTLVALGLAEPLARQVAGRGEPGWRCTFLAVGHGGCAVVEMTDDMGGRRVLVHDVGSMSGPGMIARVVEPYLRWRGIQVVDDLVISHADLDHFAGALDLVDRVRVRRVWTGPGFAGKASGAVRVFLDGLRRRSLEPGILSTGMVLDFGETLVEVLHPGLDVQAAADRANELSVVLRISACGHSLLLTGDIEGPGLTRLLESGLGKVIVLQAPHHGSRAALTPDLLAKTSPRLLVAQQGLRDALLPIGNFIGWSTRTQGAVTVEATVQGLRANAFATAEVVDLAK